ncbi:hypothetical protein [Klebsiella phage pKP-BM327-1.1]|nr:hypothetical protein [Klebsiella phage pKP-BM327-1.1]
MKDAFNVVSVVCIGLVIASGIALCIEPHHFLSVLWDLTS